MPSEAHEPPSPARSSAVGDRIVHPELGPGSIRRLKRGGRALLVSFDSNPKLLLEVRSTEVLQKPGQPETTAPEAQRAHEPPTTSSTESSVAPPRPGPFRRRVKLSAQTSERAHEAARTIEALRLGVVPHADLRSSSVGRDRELELIRSDLEEARGDGGSARVLLGDYGAGKTHMLEIIEREALAQGFIVGRATLNADFLLPNHPMRIYRAAVTSLITPGQETAASAGLEPLLRAATTLEPIMTSVARRTAPIGDHLYLGPALHYFAAVDQLDHPMPRELLIDWISGHRPEGNRELDATLRTLARTTRSFSIGPRIYALKDFQPWAHVYAYLLGGLAVLARETGHGGLVVLLDESESYDLLGSAARSFADSLFACLALATLGPERTLRAESSLDKGGFGPQRRLPTRYSPSQPLYVVSAMTPSTAGEQLLRQLVPPDRLSELSPLDQASYHELSRRISTVFEQAYPEMDLAERLSAPLGDVLWNLIDHNHIDSPREATKLTVEMLDLLRLRPDALPSFLGDVQRALR